MQNLINRIFVFLIVSGFCVLSAVAKPEQRETRFVSLKSSEVNVRTGPGLRYRIKWVIVKKGMPVEVTAEFEQWRKIRDIDKDEGWVHKSMLSGKRNVITIGNDARLIYKLPDATARPIAFLEPNVISELISCKQDWCRIKAEGKKGWLMRKYLWGVYPDEEID